MPIKKALNMEEYKKEASKECFICNIVHNGDKRAKHGIIYEDDNVIAFLNNYPTQKVQTLVCPKQHHTQIFQEVSADQYQHLFNIVRKVGLAIQEITGATRMYTACLGSNELNSHIHIHILPIASDLPYEQQQLAAFDHSEGIYVYTQEEKEQLAKEIAEKMKKY